MSGILSTATVASVGLTCKAFLNLGYCGSVTVNGLTNLVRALESESRNRGQGVVTVSNHISTLDDPVTWGVLPKRYYFSSRTTRWALGASDIIFTNPLFSTFFTLGQTLETFRGKGIYQPAVDTAINKLNRGGWVHLYGEGKVNQPLEYPRNQSSVFPHSRCLPRFKWGVGRMLIEPKALPVVIPMWLSGFDQLMPEGRPFPNKYLPRPGAHLSVTFGEPVASELIQGVLENTRHPINIEPDNKHAMGWVGKQDSNARNNDEQQLISVRTKVTALVHDAVEALGRTVAGDSLGSNR
ncbi:acyltransferase-domain-containing protein [Pluteus cervinus]|uniref:Acyltransferase-domain-containing protein n=1 Tax=Pluteus cervinus TaxID=181527 RepID=A0ACD3B3W9_9AGAR|nr:acyltransferase-domain-containing protein [Pluteus cervinus]